MRYRKSLVQERAAAVKRIQKVLEGSNIKLASVARAMMGVSGRAMLDAIVAGQTNPQAMAALAKGRLRTQLPQLQPALSGRIQPPQRCLLAPRLAPVDCLGEALALCSDELEQRLRPVTADVERLCTIPGVKHKTA